jgi:glucose uptake protein
MGFVPSIPVAFGMAVLNMVCWGSWANTMKGCKDWRFEAYYWDYAVGIFCWALVFALTLGMVQTELAPYNFFDTLARSSPEAYGWAMFSGILWNVGNVMLVAAITLAGYSIAFPLGIGTALVLGSILAHLTNPSSTHDPFSLFIGLLLITVAIMLNGLAYRLREKERAKKAEFRRGIVLSLVCGLTISMQAFPFNYAFKAGFDGYSAAVFMTLGALICTIPLMFYAMKRPLVPGRKPIGFAEYRKAGWSWHGLAWLGAFIWSSGTVSNLIVAYQPDFSVAIAYTLGQCSPMVAAIWGIFVWKEFRDAPKKVYLCLVGMFVSFIAGILFVSMAIG